MASEINRINSLSIPNSSDHFAADYFAALPDEMLKAIFDRCSLKELCNARSTCIRFYNRISKDYTKLFQEKRLNYALTHKIYHEIDLKLPSEIFSFKTNVHQLYEHKGKIVLVYSNKILLVDVNTLKLQEVSLKEFFETMNSEASASNIIKPENSQLYYGGYYYDDDTNPVEIHALSTSILNQSLTILTTTRIGDNRNTCLLIVDEDRFKVCFFFYDVIKWFEIINLYIYIGLANGEVQVWSTETIYKETLNVQNRDTGGFAIFFISNDLCGWEKDPQTFELIAQNENLKPIKTHYINDGLEFAQLSFPYLYTLDKNSLVRVYQLPDFTLLSSFHELIFSEKILTLSTGKVAFLMNRSGVNSLKIIDFQSEKKNSTLELIGRTIERNYMNVALNFGNRLIKLFKGIIYGLASVDDFLSTIIPQRIKNFTYIGLAGAILWHTKPSFLIVIPQALIVTTISNRASEEVRAIAPKSINHLAYITTNIALLVTGVYCMSKINENFLPD